MELKTASDVNLRKTMFFSLAFALVTSLSSVSVFADSKEALPGAIISPYQGEAIVIPGSNSSIVDQLVAPMAAKVSFSYSKLYPYSLSHSSITSGYFNLLSSGSVVHAEKLAELGYVMIAFDASYQGESEGGCANGNKNGIVFKMHSKSPYSL